MNRHFRSILSSTIVALTAWGCTTATLSPEGEKVHIVQSISATDLLHYEKVGPIECLFMADDRNCHNELRNEAAKIGATVVHITEKKTGQTCTIGGSNHSCVSMTADAYRPKK
jgi:hypothetical protein